MIYKTSSITFCYLILRVLKESVKALWREDCPIKGLMGKGSNEEEGTETSEPKGRILRNDGEKGLQDL